MTKFCAEWIRKEKLSSDLQMDPTDLVLQVCSGRFMSAIECI